MSAANEKVGGGTYDVVAITACPTGIAHTFMAAKGLEDQAAKMGVSIKVETQGSGGAKNVLTAADIAGAKGVIIAADKNVELDRFDGKSVYSCAVTRGINDAEELINIALAGNAPIHHVSGGAAVQAAAEGESEGLGRRVYKDLMNGVSHMLPFVVGGGNGAGLIELGGVERDGLLAENVLAGRQGGAQIGDMGVVRGGDVDGVDIRIGVEILNRVIDLLDAVLVGKSLSLGERAVGNARKLAAGQGKGLSHLVGNNAATDHSPTELGSRKDVVRERLVLDRSKCCFGGCRGVEWSLLGICHYVSPVS